MNEMSKAVIRRQRDPNFALRYLVGDGIDIGCGRDPIGYYVHCFPGITSCQAWDTIYGHGDAQLMEGVPDHAFDWLVSAHCLEHLHDPAAALARWVAIVKPGGYLVLTFPDEDLYEQGVWPSTFNPDHKRTFTLGSKRVSWSPVSVNVLDLLRPLPVQILKLELLDHAYWYDVERVDQTLTAVGESAIEVVLRTWTPDEIARGGRYPATTPGGDA